MSTPFALQPPQTSLPPVRPQQLRLNDGSTLVIADTVPADVAARRQAVRGAALYVIGGLLLDPDDPDQGGRYLAAYAGKSAALYRADTSYRTWCVQQRRLLPAGLGLVFCDPPLEPDLLSFTEARLIGALSAGGYGDILMLNTHTSALLAGARLHRGQVRAGQDLAAEIASHCWRSIFAGITNPPGELHACSNARERAVLVVRRADRALCIADIVERLAASGYRSTGNWPEFTARRDLVQRETRGTPRIHNGWYRGRRVFWAPRLTRREALAGYDRAHPRPPGCGVVAPSGRIDAEPRSA